MEILRWFRDSLIQIETWLAASSLLLLLGLAMVQIVARNFFDTGFVQAETLTRYLVLYVTFFGAALAVDRNRHIRIDVCTTLLSPTALSHLYRPLRLLAALVCGFLADAAIRFWRDEWQYAPDHEQWQVIIGLVIPVGFVMLTVQFLLGALLGPEEHA